MAHIDDEEPRTGGAAAAESGAEQRTVDEWGKIYFPPAPSGAPHKDYWKHAAAAALHRWTLYAHDQNGAMRLSQSDYEAALGAAQTTNAQGAAEAHPSANYGDAK